MSALLLVLLAGVAMASDAYVETIEEWRAAREARLTADAGWLTVVGLEWLEDGRYRIGSDPKADIVLPASVPATAGTLSVAGKRVEFTAADGVEARSDGKLVRRHEFGEDTGPVDIGSVSFFVIERGSRLALRIRDTQSEARRRFAGLTWYPIDARWRGQARLEPPSSSRSVPIATIVGEEIQLESAGVLVFTLEGRELRLEALFDDPERKELFVMFKDRTNGEETYGAGRYMYLPVPEDGTVDLDFNKAYNPPCVFTDFATCPLPPSQNWLPVAIEAGERNYK